MFFFSILNRQAVQRINISPGTGLYNIGRDSATPHFLFLPRQVYRYLTQRLTSRSDCTDRVILQFYFAADRQTARRVRRIKRKFSWPPPPASPCAWNGSTLTGKPRLTELSAPGGISASRPSRGTCGECPTPRAVARCIISSRPRHRASWCFVEQKRKGRICRIEENETRICHRHTPGPPVG